MRRMLLYAAFALGALLFAGAIGAYVIVLAPNTTGYQGERGVKIPRGAGFSQALDSLEAAGILASRGSIALLGRATGWGNQVKAGYYTFESGASNRRMLDVIRRGLQSPLRVTLPPGTRPSVMAAVAGRMMAFEGDEFYAALTDTSLASSLETDTRMLFGYMMPETYFFYWLTSPEAVIKRVKEEFDAYYETSLAGRAEAQGLTKQELTILASIVEWESDHADEKPAIAGVYLNRLRRGMPLQADPTVQYAVLASEGARRRLLYQDYQIQHPYNTYLIGGLPPGPITNPSQASLRAVAEAEDHNFLYFVARGDGRHTFSRTLAEHNRAARQYHELMRQRRAEQQNRSRSDAD